MDNFEVITFKRGKNVDYVPINSEHVKIYQKWVNDPDVRKYLIQHFPKTLEEIKKWFDPKPEGLRNEIIFEIWHKEGKKPIGIMGLVDINWIYRFGFIIIYIGEIDYWGQNIATESLKLLIEYGFNEVNLNKIMGWINVENKASLRAAEKAGLSVEAHTKQMALFDGKYMDVKLYSIFNEEWIKEG